MTDVESRAIALAEDVVMQLDVASDVCQKLAAQAGFEAIGRKVERGILRVALDVMEYLCVYAPDWDVTLTTHDTSKFTLYVKGENHHGQKESDEGNKDPVFPGGPAEIGATGGLARQADRSPRTSTRT